MDPFYQLQWDFSQAVNRCKNAITCENMHINTQVLQRVIPILKSASAMSSLSAALLLQLFQQAVPDLAT